MTLDTLLSDSASAVAYMVRGITHVCRNMKKRSPGSDGEREAAEYMAQVLESECGCTDVRVEAFDEHPGGFYGYLYFSAVLDVICGAAFFFLPALSILSGVLAILLMLFQFILYHEIVDRFFALRRGTNVTAVRPCAGECRRRVFLNGHLDAAWEWPLNYHFGGVVFEAHSVGATVGVLYYIALSVCRLCGAGAWARTAGWIGLLFFPFWIGLPFLRNKNRVVDGANDNLSGCYMGVALLRAMELHGITLEHTEVGVLLTGSEESGLRGAKAWSRAHREEYADVPTFIYSFDTIHDPRFLMTNERDLNGTVKADRAMSELFLTAAAELGIPCRRGWVPPMGGGTDSAAFLQGGFRAVCITGLNHRLEDYYHTRRDSCDNLDARGLENCYRAAVKTVEKIDAGALDRTQGRSPTTKRKDGQT
ncbi:MAG: M28 family peptidase [Oscillospiraceae bacterium]|nr:M28 family peptidase [Oscillospiraceae bacterium]